VRAGVDAMLYIYTAVFLDGDQGDILAEQDQIASTEVQLPICPAPGCQ
jgi:hypothetical protein